MDVDVTADRVDLGKERKATSQELKPLTPMWDKPIAW